MIPSKEILIELLRPGSDSERTDLYCCNMKHSDKISDFDSQLVLQKYSNHLVEQIGNDEHINCSCEELNIDKNEAQYHFALIDYIYRLYPEKMPNVEILLPGSVQINNVYLQHRAGKEVLALGKDFESLIGFDPETCQPGENSHEMYLRDRFPEYAISRDYAEDFQLKAIHNKCDGVSSTITDNQRHIYDFDKTRREGYIDRNNQMSSMARQCPFCPTWFEQKPPNNGKFTPFCSSRCECEWERVRKNKLRHSKRLNGWVKEHSTRKRCLGCAKSRLVNSNRVCKKCFSENHTQSKF